MKCIDKKKKRRRSRRQTHRRRRLLLAVGSILILLLVLLVAGITALVRDRKRQRVTEYESSVYAGSVYRTDLFAGNLCTANGDIELAGYPTDASLQAAALFAPADKKVLYAQNLHGRLYPASTTKILTAYTALKHSSLSDVVTVSENAVTFTVDAQVCNLMPGDTVTMEALLNGLLLHSGNDAAIAIAEHISGSVEGFVELMNEEAAKLGATNTHFVNPHGLHDDAHYTTAYDLYLMFDACLQNETFVNIISQNAYTAQIQNPDLGIRTEVWEASHYYSQGLAIPPSNVTVVGGKTGTENLSGSCLVLLSRDSLGNPYISIVMGADDKTILYNDMTALMSAIPPK